MMVEQKKFLGARIEPQILSRVDSVAEEYNINRTSAIKILVNAGWKDLQLKRAIELYRKGKISIDKAAEISEISVSEMMQEIALYWIKSEESIEEYREGVKRLLKK